MRSRLRQDHWVFQASFVYRVRSYLKKQNQTLTATRDLLPECLGTVVLQVEMTWGRGKAGLQIPVMTPGRGRTWVVPGRMADEHRMASS